MCVDPLHQLERGVRSFLEALEQLDDAVGSPAAKRCLDLVVREVAEPLEIQLVAEAFGEGMDRRAQGHVLEFEALDERLFADSWSFDRERPAARLIATRP